MPKSGRPNPELTKPRIARGGGPMPTHVSYVFAESDGRYRLQIHERGAMRSQLGFHRELVCADTLEYDAQMEFLIEKRVPFMVGHMSPGASDDAFFWLKEKGRRIDYLEIAFGGKTEWEVREIFEDAKEWRGVKLKELLLPEIDLFDPANRPRVLRPAPPAEPEPSPPLEPEPPAAAEPEPPAPAEPEPPAPAEPEPPAPAEPEPPAAAEPEPPAPAEPEPPAPAEPEPPPPPEPEPPPATNPPPAAPSRETSGRPMETPDLPGRRWVDYGSALLPILLIGGSFWRATHYFRIVELGGIGSLLTDIALPALVGGTAYVAVWVRLFPRHFVAWRDRLQLWGLAIIAAGLITTMELMMANVRHDDAPLVELRTTVISKSIYKGKYGRAAEEYWAWQVAVEPWKPDGDTQSLRVSRETWGQLQPGHRILFRAHPGWLGRPWYRFEEAEVPGFVTVLNP